MTRCAASSRDAAVRSSRPGEAARCRGCAGTDLAPVLDLGTVAAADDFPPAGTPVDPAETAHPLAMLRCAECGLAQLARDDTVTREPRGVEPRALRDQAADAVARVADSGLLRGSTAREFGSPHGGSWLPLLTERGFEITESRADLVIDCFGIMHEPDQRAAFARRAAAVGPDGVLLLQYHSLRAIVRLGQWNALRHGHFGYYTLPVLSGLLGAAGMSVAHAWEFDLYGGTVLLAAVHGAAAPGESVRRIAAAEAAATDLDAVRGLQRAADAHALALRTRLERESAAGRTVFAYGAASRAVGLFCRAGLHRGLLAGVADASPAKWGRRMPGTDIPIIAPGELVAADPDRVLLTVPDLLAEVTEQYPELNGRWILDGAEPHDIANRTTLHGHSR
ncbi:methyltransferase domain-containing protein [Nocardia sp. NPDC005978]|uniref:class I SAM-dependent methyltransferase n=1 Tax=Nocardia sp. NPDC005978 TaxID=3156725 RepID=UPI0033A51F9E